MKREFPSLRLCEKDAKVHFKRHVDKYSRDLFKTLFTKVDKPNDRMVLVPLDQELTSFNPEDYIDDGQLTSKRNFDRIKKKTEIKKK